METKPSMNGVHVEPAAEDVQEEVAEEPAPMSQAEDQIAFHQSRVMIPLSLSTSRTRSVMPLELL